MHADLADLEKGCDFGRGPFLLNSLGKSFLWAWEEFSLGLGRVFLG
jgi:hypothetical protein